MLRLEGHLSWAAIAADCALRRKTWITSACGALNIIALQRKRSAHLHQAWPATAITFFAGRSR
jgi:hypothetical protein